MSLFNWFYGKSISPTTPTAGADNSSGSGAGSAARDSAGRLQPVRDKSVPTHIAGMVFDPTNRSEERKVRRQTRREQLYLAVREAFTHAGVLSSTYKFKVLSLDQVGNEFMVMMDVDQSFDHRPEKLASIETKVVHIAKSHYEILVTSVYWRVSTLAPAPARPAKAAPQTALQTAPQATPQTAPPPDHQAAPVVVAAVTAVAPKNPDIAPTPPKKPSGSRYDPIQDDEVTAFKKALMAASANSPAPSASSGVKTRSGPRSYALLTGFEDTEMPESSSAPVLSATQYGDLN